MKSNKLRWALALTTVSLAGCGDDDGMPAGTADSGAVAVHECTPYTSLGESGTANDKWSEPNDESPTHTITAPGDPGGGHFVVTLGGFEGTGVAGQMEVRGGTNGTVIGTSTVSNGTRGSAVSAAFTTAPGASYEIRPRQFLNESPENYPVDYSLSWEFVPAEDCYEPNDTFAEAKRIPGGERLEAYLLAGFRDARPTEEEYADYYEIEALAAGEMAIDFVQVPPDLTIQFEVFDATMASVGSANNGAGGAGSLFDHTVTLDEPGTYYLKVTPWLIPDVFVGDDAEPPPSWTMPYAFELGLP